MADTLPNFSAISQAAT